MNVLSKKRQKYKCVSLHMASTGQTNFYHLKIEVNEQRIYVFEVFDTKYHLFSFNENYSLFFFEGGKHDAKSCKAC